MMGVRLVKFYEQAKAKAGIPGMVKLAITTRLPSVLAESTPDTPENIRLFEQAIKDLGL